MTARSIITPVLFLACLGSVPSRAAHLPLELVPLEGVEDAFEPALPLEDGRPTVIEGRLDLRPADPNADWSVEVQPWDISRGGAALMGIAVPSGAPLLDGHRLEQQRGAITETFTSFTDGLEQALTLNWTPPGDPADASYSWRFIVRGGSVHVAASGLSAHLVQPAAGSGAVVELLGAADSEGRELPARFESLPPLGPLSVVVDDRDAVAPTTVRLRWRSLNTVLEPEALLTAYGRIVSSAGDIDGDGFTDLAVSARRWSEPQPAAGRVFVHRGGPGGIERSPAWTLSGSTANSEFGAAVASAGDVDGNGFDDLLIGEAGLSRVHLFLSSADGLASDSAWTFQGGADTDAGWSLAGAGDVNGDGHADVLVGEPRADGAAGLDVGRAMLFLGGPDGLSDVADQVFEGSQGFSHFGRALAGAGDVNGDGMADVLFGAPLHDSSLDDDGRVVLHFGTSDGLSELAAVELQGEIVAGRFGESLAGLGDVNGDGFGDVAIAAPRASDSAHPEAGQVQVFLGPDLQHVETLWGVPNARFGQSVAAAGDVNGDGLADLAVGAPLQDEGHGSLSLFLGRGEGMDREPALVRSGALANSEFGMSVAGLGAADADGFSDVAVGAWYHQGPFGWAQGRVLVLAGHGLLTRSVRAPVAPEIWSVDAIGQGGLVAGDLNLDGYSDIVAGCSGYSGGLVAVFPGSPAGLAQVPARRIERTDQFFGHSVAIVSDAEGDGVPDLVVGSDAGYGRLDLYRGSRSVVVEATAAWTFEGTPDDWACGRKVIDAGDIDGDGFGDFATQCDGHVRIFHGGADGPREAGSRPGRKVAGAGDVNGDGYSDLIVGRDVYFGSTAGLSEGPDFSLSTAWEIAPAGDVNGDGLADVLVGGASRIRVAYGAPDGLVLTEPLDYVGTPFTFATNAGDLDGDGSHDFVSLMGIPFGGRELNLYRGGDAALSLDSARSLPSGTPYALTHGDVDGDGRPDLVGAYRPSGGHSDLFVFPGGNGGAARRLRVRHEGNPLTPFSHVSGSRELEVRFGAVSSMGRQRIRLEWQLALAGESWDEAVTETGDWQDSGAPEVGDHAYSMTLPEELDGAFRWRVRLRGRAPFPWVTPWQSRPSLAHDTHQRIEGIAPPGCELEPSDLQNRPAAEPFRIERGGGGTLGLAWEDTGAGSWSVYRGTLQGLWAAGDYDHRAAGACRVAVSTASLPSPADDSYYLVESDCGTWSSTGRDSLGNERPGPTEPCP